MQQGGKSSASSPPPRWAAGGGSRKQPTHKQTQVQGPGVLGPPAPTPQPPHSSHPTTTAPRTPHVPCNASLGEITPRRNRGMRSWIIPQLPNSAQRLHSRSSSLNQKLRLGRGPGECSLEPTLADGWESSPEQWAC